MPGEGTARLDAFAELLEHLREPMLIASAEGRIRAANAASADALGTSLRTLDGASLASYSADPVALAAQLRRPSQESKLPLRARDGRRFSCDTKELGPDLVLVRLSGSEHEATRAKHLFDGLSRLAPMASADGLTLDAIAGPLLAQAAASLGALSCCIFLVDEARTNLELKVAAAPCESAGRYRLIPLSAHLPITDAVKKGVPVFLEGSNDYAAAYPQFAALHPELARNGFASLPLEIDGIRMGALTMSFDAATIFGAEERAFLSFVAVQCTNAIGRASETITAPTTTNPSAARIERLHTFAGALAQAITPAEVIEVVVEMGRVATSAASAELWLLSSEHNEVSLARSVGANAMRAEDWKNVKLDRTSRLPVLDAILAGLPMWIESGEQLLEEYPDIQVTEPMSFACVPLFAQGRNIGGLSFGFTGAHPFLEASRGFLQVIAWHAAQAIERARLYSAARRAKDAAEESRRRSDFIADIGTLLSSSLDVADILQSISQAAVPRVADWCIVKVASERLQLATFASHVDPDKQTKLVDMSNRITALGDEAFGVAHVMRTGKSLHHPRITMEMVRGRLGGDPELIAIVDDIQTASAIVVPIAARGSVFGAIVLSRCTPENAFDTYDLAAAEELGKRVGLAVDNARLYQESREADRVKDEFLAMLSHELRNPLAPILTALELMNLRHEGQFTRERAIISRHVHQVVRLVDDLLDVSRVTRGKVQLSKHPCELSSIVATAIEMVAPLTKERHHRLKLVTTETGLSVSGDSARLAQAVGNILTNAAKYTAPGGEITVTLAAEDGDAVVRVRDSGMGIAPALLPRVFDLFVQGETSLDRAPGGLGVGLTVVKRIVQMHDGSVSAFSEGIGHGTEFAIRLPLDANARRADLRSNRPPQPPMNDNRVLIVDDNRDAADLLGDALESLGWSVQIAYEGATALTLASIFRPNLCLLDIGLPMMDGYELARSLRQLDFGFDVRLVAVSGYGQSSDRDRSREAGFDEHIVKPVHLDTLRRVIERSSAAPAT